MQAPYTGFESVYRRELPFVWAAARRFGVHPAAIDDAVQDVFLTAYRRWSDLHYEVSPRAWLYGVTRRVAFRYRRSEARTARRKAAVTDAGKAPGLASTPHRSRDEAHDVNAVLAVLEPTRREVFVMADLLDMSGPDIAAQLGIPLNTVYSRLRLARRELEPRLRRGVMAWTGSVRKHDQPPPEQAQRTWAVLAPMLGAGPGGGVVGAWTLGRLVGVVAAAGLLTVAAIAGGPAPRESTREAREAQAVAGSAGPRACVRAGPPASSLASEEGAAALEPVATRPAVVVAAKPAKPEPPSPERMRSPVPSSDPSAPAPAAAPAAPSALGLADEVAMLDHAAAALREGDAARSLQWLTDHERQFPSGRLADVRKATRVRALCRLGRAAQASAEAQALRREHPESAVAKRAPRSCEEA